MQTLPLALCQQYTAVVHDQLVGFTLAQRLPLVLLLFRVQVQEDSLLCFLEAEGPPNRVSLGPRVREVRVLRQGREVRGLQVRYFKSWFLET